MKKFLAWCLKAQNIYPNFQIKKPLWAVYLILFALSVKRLVNSFQHPFFARLFCRRYGDNIIFSHSKSRRKHDKLSAACRSAELVGFGGDYGKRQIVKIH